MPDGVMHVIVYQSPFEAWLWTTTAGNVVLLAVAGVFSAALIAFAIAWRNVRRRIEAARQNFQRGMR